MEIGRHITAKWLGKPVFIWRRAQKEIASAEADNHAKLIDPAADSWRVQRKQWMIVIGIPATRCASFKRIRDWFYTWE